jgi:xylan 1,4-beta-xylosidase
MTKSPLLFFTSFLLLNVACGSEDPVNVGPGSGGTSPEDGESPPWNGPIVETGACTAEFPTADVSAAPYRIQVKGGESWGALPHFWDTLGTGHLGLYLREDSTNYFGDPWGPLLQEHTREAIANLGLKRMRSHGLFHDDIGIYSEDENGEPVYNFENSDKIFDFYVEEGISPIIELAPMPAALASDPAKTVFDWGMIVSPPKDYGLWQELVRRFAEHSLERYGEEVVATWDWEVWNEPECCNNKFWSGTMDDYFRLYDHSAAGVRAALPNARVGGPVTSQPQELTNNSHAGELFLDHVTTDNYVTPGSPGILDFFSYHSWSFVGGAVDGYFAGLDLLSSYGLNDTPIAITEFGPTWEFNLFDEPQEMHQGAAFVAQTFSDISRRCAEEEKPFPLAYSWWVLSDVFEEEKYREADPFIGCMGLISREGIKKPAYNTYKFLAQMGEEQLALRSFGGAGVGGMATRDLGGAVQLIVYNGQNPGNGPSDDTYYEERSAEDVGITLKGLNPTMSYDVDVYRIDENNGNAYKRWQEWGRPEMAALSDDQWAELRSIMESPAESLRTAACGETFSQTFSLSSPGVLFITLSPVAP